MVFRKPYAFLIKNFKKIHLLLLLLWVYIYYKMYILKGFVSEFITFGTYNKNLEGISTKITIPFYLSIILVIIISIAMLVLLIYKKKPWKIYLAPILVYILMIYGLISVTSFFNSYTVITNVSDIFLSRDILNIARLLQYPVLAIIIMRITGLDLKKFKFNTDEEFLELTNKDREEFEVSISVDKNSFIRTYRRLKRNIGYVYQEHKLIINIILIALSIILIGYTYYFFGIKNKTYKQGDIYSAGIYDIQINDVYITDKDASGNIIEKGNKFVIVVATIKNKSNKKQNPNFSRYHLMNKNTNNTNTIYYDDDFKDIGKGISSDNNIQANQTKKFMLVYKVPKELENKHFALYYQEYNGKNETHLRKIKINYKDVSKVAESKNYNMEEEIIFKLLNNTEKEIVFNTATFNDAVEYNKYTCDGINCLIETFSQNAQNNKKILKIEFFSSDFEGKEFIDFTKRYGIIKYVDNDNKKHTETIESAINSEYEGKEIYILTSKEVEAAKEVYIDYKIRDKEYTVKIK